MNGALGRKEFMPWWMGFFLLSLILKVVIGAGNQYKSSAGCQWQLPALACHPSKAVGDSAVRPGEFSDLLSVTRPSFGFCLKNALKKCKKRLNKGQNPCLA